MTEENTTPLRERMIEDMRIRGMGEKAQKAHIRAIKDFAAFLGRSPDTATPEELRAYQLHMTDRASRPRRSTPASWRCGSSSASTCAREEMKRHMQFQRQAAQAAVVLSVEEVAELLAAAPGPGLKYRAALGIGYGAGLRASEVCNAQGRRHRQRPHADPCRAGQGRARTARPCCRPALLDLLRDYWREARPAGLAVSRASPGSIRCRRVS